MKEFLYRWLVGRPMSKIYRAMWLLMRKQKETIDGREIQYLRLPWWLLIGGVRAKSLFVDGMFVYHPPFRTPMIFLSDVECESKKFRYTLYHEYWEAFFRFCDQSQFENIRPMLTEGFGVWLAEFPDAEKIVERAVRQGQSENHIRALALELRLAKIEMPPEKFRQHLQEIMGKRL